MTDFAVPPPPDDWTPPSTHRVLQSPNGDPDKGACPDCGKMFNVNQDGSIRKHNCPGYAEISTTASTSTGTPRATPKSRGRTARGGKKAGTPPKVRHLGSALIASGAEWVAAQTFSRAVPCQPGEIPTDLPEPPGAEGMVGPFLDLLWPQIPAGGQKIIANIAEQEDLIVAALAWFQWFKTIREWADAKSAEVKAEPATPGLLTVVPTMEGPPANVTPQESEPWLAGTGSFEPFTPVDPASQAFQ